MQYANIEPNGRGDMLGTTMEMHVGDVIRTLRETRTDLSARALSLAAGLSESYVGKIESNQVEPSFRAFSKIAVQLGMKPAEVYVLITHEANR